MPLFFPSGIAIGFTYPFSITDACLSFHFVLCPHDVVLRKWFLNFYSPYTHNYVGSRTNVSELTHFAWLLVLKLTGHIEYYVFRGWKLTLGLILVKLDTVQMKTLASQCDDKKKKKTTVNAIYDSVSLGQAFNLTVQRGERFVFQCP